MQSGGLRTKNIIKQSLPEQPLITVVTVVRNGKKTLEETILSVINQTYQNVEYIVVDGASTDGTLDIIRKYEERIDYWISEPDAGIYDAMNKGIDVATGDYIALLHSDDWYELNTCATVAKEIIDNHVDICYGMMRIMDRNSGLQWIYGYTHNCLEKYMIAHPTCFIKKDIYKQFKYDIKYRSAADYDFMLRLKANGFKFCFIEKILANYSLGGMSDSNLGQKESNSIQWKYKVISPFKYFCRILYLFLNNKIRPVD
jgi:glycosyltransferase involved in cell wall biosynthesis